MKSKQKFTMLENMVADEDKVKELLLELMQAWNTIIQTRLEQGESVRFLDGLMALHNFHKHGIIEIADEATSGKPESAKFIFEMAEGTFSRAMDEQIHRLNIPEEEDS